MRGDFIYLKQVFLEAKRNVPQNDFYYGSMLHKFKHSVEVFYIGKKIMETTPELEEVGEEFRDYACKALLFHDVGRFEEAVKNYEKEKKNVFLKAASNTFDHGRIGYELLKNNSVYGDLRVLCAVLNHGKMMDDILCSGMWQNEVVTSPHFDEIKKNLYLVRDADKLANLRVIVQEDHLKKDLFYKQLTKDAMRAPVSDVVMQQFFEQKVILFPTVYSFADRILQVLSWIYDLNYVKSIEIFNKEKYGDYLLSQLVEYHSNTDDMKKIRQAVLDCFANEKK